MLSFHVRPRQKNIFRFCVALFRQDSCSPTQRLNWSNTQLGPTFHLACSTQNSCDKVVADFGCGCGTLGVAAALLGAEHVIGIDVDPESLELASLNAEELELDIDYIQCNIKNLEWRAGVVDTVVMNPPFGTRTKGADMDFLCVALKVASQAVYSLHKTSTRDHVKRAALQQFNATSAEVICELRYGLPQTYKFHKKRDVDIAVDLWRFVPKNKHAPEI